MKRLFFLFAIILFSATACDIYPTEAEKASGESALQIVSSDIFFTPAGGEGSIVVDADGVLSASTSAPWCHLEVKDNRYVFVTADQARSNESRYAKITLRCDQEETYVVAQQTGIILREFGLENVVEFAKYGGAVSFPYASDTPIIVSCDDDWAVVTVNEDGLTIFVNEYDQVRTTHVNWEIQGFKSGVITVRQDGNWKSLGNCPYTDAFLSAAFNVENKTYEVEIQKSLRTEGVFRMVNPYGAAYPYNEPGDYDTSAYHYMVIHAEDQNAVTIDEFHSGMDWTYGEFLMKTSTSGTLKDKVITFPTGALALYIPGYGWFNSTSAGKIDMSALNY